MESIIPSIFKLSLVISLLCIFYLEEKKNLQIYQDFLRLNSFCFQIIYCSMCKNKSFYYQTNNEMQNIARICNVPLVDIFKNRWDIYDMNDLHITGICILSWWKNSPLMPLFASFWNSAAKTLLDWLEVTKTFSLSNFFWLLEENSLVLMLAISFTAGLSSGNDLFSLFTVEPKTFFPLSCPPVDRSP